MTVRLRVIDGIDLATDLGLLPEAYGIEWTKERLDVGGGQFTIRHDAPELVAQPGRLAANNVVIVEDDDVPGWEGFPFLIRRRNRTRSGTSDPIQVVGPGAIEVLRQAVVYPARGITGPPQDVRAFGWYAWDYLLDDDWSVVTDSLGTYANPTDPQLEGDPGEDAVNEIQEIVIDADDPPFPWGSSYPSPGGLTGTWQITFRGQTTAGIPWDASAGQVASALQALSNIDGVDVSGSGTSGSPYVVEFTGSNVAGRSQNLMQLTHDDLRHDHSTTRVTRVQSGSQAVEGEELIENWPDSRSEWFGNFGELNHYRRVLDVEAAGANAGPVMVYVVSLGDVDVWWDGEHLGQGSRFDVLQLRTDLFTTQHVLAFRADAPTMITVQRIDDNDNPTGAVYRTFTEAVFGGSGAPEDWFQYLPGEEPPGVTPGFILKRLFDDGKDRGAIADAVTMDFDEDVDSLGREWRELVEMGFQIGNDSVLSVAERLRDLEIATELTAGFVFRAYDGVRVDRGATPDDGVSTVTVGLDQAHELGKETEDEQLSALLVRTEDEWIELHEGAPRREGFLSLGTVSSRRSAQMIGRKHLRDFETPRQMQPWVTTQSQDVPQPATDYDVGDVIRGPRLGGGLVTGDWLVDDVIVDTVAARVTAEGDVDWVHETEDADQ